MTISLSAPTAFFQPFPSAKPVARVQTFVPEALPDPALPVPASKVPLRDRVIPAAFRAMLAHRAERRALLGAALRLDALSPHLLGDVGLSDIRPVGSLDRMPAARGEVTLPRAPNPWYGTIR